MSEFDPKTLEGHEPQMDEIEKKKKPKKRKKVVKKTEIVFSFPSRSRCPRCDSPNTIRYATEKSKQYRRCQMPLCRKTYCVFGEEI